MRNSMRICLITYYFMLNSGTMLNSTSHLHDVLCKEVFSISMQNYTLFKTNWFIRMITRLIKKFIKKLIKILRIFNAAFL